MNKQCKSLFCNWCHIHWCSSFKGAGHGRLISLHSVAPELQVFVSSLKISPKRAHPWTWSTDLSARVELVPPSFSRTVSRTHHPRLLTLKDRVEPTVTQLCDCTDSSLLYIRRTTAIPLTALQHTYFSKKL